MHEVDPGHLMYLESLDNIQGRVQELRYVKREGEKYPGNKGHYAGTTVQEVCRGQIARLKYVRYQAMLMDDEESVSDDYLCILDQRSTIEKLERRAARRAGRPFKYVDGVPIEQWPTCRVCGHVNPELHEHPISTGVSGPPWPVSPPREDVP